MKKHELKNKTKKELIKIIFAHQAGIQAISNKHTNKLAQIRILRQRLLKIRNSIDYLLKHPFSSDNNFNTRKDKRDRGIRLSQSKLKRNLK